MIRYILAIHHGNRTQPHLNRPLEGLYLSRLNLSKFDLYTGQTLTRKRRYFIRFALYSKVREKEFAELLKPKIKEKV